MRQLFVPVVLGVLCLSCTADRSHEIEALEAQIQELTEQLEQAQQGTEIAELRESPDEGQVDADILSAAGMILRRVERFTAVAEALGIPAQPQYLETLTLGVRDACADLANMTPKPDTVRTDEVPEEFRPFLSDGRCAVIGVAFDAGPVDVATWEGIDRSVGISLREDLDKVPDLSAAQLASVMQNRRDGVLGQ